MESPNVSRTTSKLVPSFSTEPSEARFTPGSSSFDGMSSQ